MFLHILCRFGADITLPRQPLWSDVHLNFYALVASSKHQDLWFLCVTCVDHHTVEPYSWLTVLYGDKFRGIGLQPTHPQPGYTTVTHLWAHPLYHSLCSRSWELSLRLIDLGASIFDQVAWDTIVFERILITDDRLAIHVLQFVFPIHDQDKDVV